MSWEKNSLGDCSLGSLDSLFNLIALLSETTCLERLLLLKDALARQVLLYYMCDVSCSGVLMGWYYICWDTEGGYYQKTCFYYMFHDALSCGM